MSSPGSSSSLSYESVFDRSRSRATTPSSIVSDGPQEKPSLALQLPNTSVCISSPAIDSDVVKTLFTKHSTDGRLGLYVPFTPGRRQSTSAFEGWEKETICLKGADVEYLISSSSSFEELECSVSTQQLSSCGSRLT